MSATVFDAGTHFIVSGPDEASVAAKAAELAAGGMKVIALPAQVGNKWIASLENPRTSAPVHVEKFGMKSVVTGPTREAVAEKVSQLQLGGATIEQPPELIDGVWTAVCDGPL
jgi:hypothetical protein